jgi:HlyD family secretion protein
MRTPSLPRYALPVAAVLGLSLLAACGKRDDAVYQGYVEGEYLYIASSEAGRLDTLSVQRG